MTGPPAFEKTLRAIENDNPRAQTITLLLAVVILGTWTSWYLTSPIPNPPSQVPSPQSPAPSPQ